MLRSAALVATAWACLTALVPSAAHADATGATVRALGTSAARLLGGRPPLASSQASAIVELPGDIDATSLGLVSLGNGFGLLAATPDELARFAFAHPTLPLSITPPLRPKLDLEVPFIDAAPSELSLPLDGSGVYVGIVDTGVDVGHPDFLDASGETRVAWVLDLATPARPGVELDQAYGARTWTHAELVAAMAAGGALPGDTDGHGTHVAGIATSNGGPGKRYVGVAPKATLVVVNASRDGSGAIYEADATLGVKFVFDRAALDGKPAVANLSIGSQFGPHDDTSSFERSLGALTGGAGRAIVAAASNEGSDRIHAEVHTGRGETARVPIRLAGTDGNGRAYGSAQIYVWITYRDGKVPKLGLEGPSGDTWLSPLDAGGSNEVQPIGGVDVVAFNQLVDASRDDRVPAGSHGAVVVLSGALPVGDYQLLVDGEATFDAWIQGGQDAFQSPGAPFFPRGAQVDGTIGIPASSFSVIAAGCVGLRAAYRDSVGQTFGSPNYAPLFDPLDVPMSQVIERAVPSRRCWFASAGPSANGSLRPDVLAPGLFVPSTLSRQALVGTNATFDRTSLVDSGHAVLSGTSMSSPFVAGAAALLLERSPSATQEQIRGALQAGARPLLGEGDDHWTYGNGAGIIDVRAALTALDAPSGAPATSVRLQAADEFLPLDGTSLQLIAVVQDTNGAPADVDGFAFALTNAALASAIEHPARGLYRATIRPSAGLGQRATITTARGPSASIALPIGQDRWDATEGVGVGGGCVFGAPSETRAPRGAQLAVASAGLAMLVRRARITKRRRK
jgi:subtilisin family serine protease